jgi:hypothetical protein
MALTGIMKQIMSLHVKKVQTALNSDHHDGTTIQRFRRAKPWGEHFNPNTYKTEHPSKNMSGAKPQDFANACQPDPK